jgi:hypothetical protein
MSVKRIPYGNKHGKIVTAPLDWAACGSPANYRAHLRRGEPACRACKKAEARDRRDRPYSRCHQCDRAAQVHGLCATHFKAEYGITVHAYRNTK